MTAGLDRSPDRPIRDAEQDRLGLGPFVDGLARSLVADDGRRARGVVIGLEGPWGSGKSSILNLVAQRLSNGSKDGDESPKPEPVVVRFDPWLVSGREDLIASFLRVLVDAIDPVGRERARFGSLVSKLARYGEMVAPAAGFLGAAVGEAVGGAMKALAQATAPAGNPFELREALEEALAAFDRPIVVLIDELDRVEDAEVRTMAQLVRSVMDFPSISYLLAYDPQRVAEALGGGASAEARRRGEAYLEKIVQLRVPVPAPPPGKLLELLEEDVRELLRATPIARYVDGDRLRSVLRLAGGSGAGDEPLIGTLRDLHRVLGIFAALEPMLRWEIDPVDLLGWSILLAKRPADVERLKASMALLCKEALGDGYSGLRSLALDPTPFSVVGVSEKERIEAVSKVVHPLCAGLLSPTRSVFRSTPTGWEGSQTLRLPNAVCWPDRLLTVLTHGTHTPRVTAADAIRALQNEQAFRQAFLDAWANGSVASFLFALRVAAQYVFEPDQKERSAEVLREWRRWFIELAEADDLFALRSGARRRHELLALGFVALFHRSQLFEPEPERDTALLLEAIAQGKVVLACHLVWYQLQRVPGQTVGRAKITVAHEPLGSFTERQVRALAEEIATWARAKLEEKCLLRSLRDAVEIRVLEVADVLDPTTRAAIREEMDNDADFDHLVALCFADKASPLEKAVLYMLLPDFALLQSRLESRAQSLPGAPSEEWPPGLEEALEWVAHVRRNEEEKARSAPVVSRPEDEGEPNAPLNPADRPRTP